jgi:hypothetical protein
LVLAGFTYLYREVGSFASVPRLVILSPAPNATIAGNAVLVEGLTDRDAKLSLNGQPILVNDEGRFRENLVLQPGSNIISVKAVNRFAKEISEVLTVQANYPEENQSAENATTNEALDKNLAENTEITLEVRVDPGPVWVSVKADGNLVFSGTMLLGAVQSFSAKEKISVDSGRAEATFIKFNGKEIGPLGEKPGAIKNVVFTKETKY